ncbi:MAG: NAD(P)/FAD-dependent oxidoreductase [Acidobacteriota bacterium]
MTGRTGRDVVVVGGGPAGLAAAIAIRLTGRDVTVVERDAPPIDRVCGEGLMPDGVQCLSRLGVTIPASAVHRFSGIRYLQDGIDAVARFRHGPGLGMRRWVLHGALTRRAEQVGVKMLWRTCVRRAGPTGVETDGGFIPARWVVAADGGDSPLRRSLGLDRPPTHRRFGLRTHYEIRPWNDLVEVYWGNGCEMYVTPVAPFEVCVTALAAERGLTFDSALARFPRLACRLAGARRADRVQGAGTVFRRLDSVVTSHVALLGDASGSVDAITGDGVTLAFHQAVALASALADDDLAAYGAAHRRIMRLPFRMTALMLAIDRRPWLRRQVLRGLAAVPGLFRALLTIHTRDLGVQQHGPALRELSHPRPLPVTVDSGPAAARAWR